MKLTTGHERGAASYVDNLISSKNGRFLKVWEGEMLNSFFSNIRNPMSHGAGSSPPEPLDDGQIGWTIDFCMAWIKDLIFRFSQRI
ncbi:MAG: hypothetical protein EWM45_11925 [Rhodopseudomonas palustris]|nr:MAG: hypothetical protein EWM45_11925 [Rhodopseudomonas palustris]